MNRWDCKINRSVRLRRPSHSLIVDLGRLLVRPLKGPTMVVLF